jgi:hypothetical protein
VAEADDKRSTLIAFWTNDWVSLDDIYARLMERLHDADSAVAALNRVVPRAKEVGAIQILPGQQAQHYLVAPGFLEIVVGLNWSDPDSDGVYHTVRHVLLVRVKEPGKWRFFLKRAEADAIFAPVESTKAKAPKITKVDRAKRDIQVIYKRPPHEIPTTEAGTSTVQKRVNDELNLSGNDRYPWDTINRALGRDPHREA